MAKDFNDGSVKNFISGKAPLFNVVLRNSNGEAKHFSAFDACEITECAEYCQYKFKDGFTVTTKANSVESSSCITWGIKIENNTDMAIEYVDYPNLAFKPLIKNGGIGKILLPYNEGVIIDDAYDRDKDAFGRQDLEYPSKGSYYVFPNMMSSQFMAYLTDGGGVYIGAHDEKRGLKGFDYVATDDGVTLSVRTYTGKNFSEDYELDFPIVTKEFSGSWEDAADIYRDWFECHLPSNVQKVKENKNLLDWYADFPLIIAYPVRGMFDTDEMNPNALFPYMNAMPLVEEIAKETNSRVMALLMHWEGTAPWAPPYVWPPYGGAEEFNKFRDALHDKGHLLGVYCSGFGWTYKSNLTDYNRTHEWESGEVESAMCAGPDGKVGISRICTDQRSGYDLCPASDKAKEILSDAYTPLFESGIDYAQILDQNHGGGQYLCYSRSHGHPPMPGAWMTENMQKLLEGWNKNAPGMLFGCESAAAEPFIGNLLFSDNRYELTHFIGTPVPLYAYIYHEYLHNFMGNQVCCPLDPNADTLCERLAYSFSTGDCMTLVMMPDGVFLPHWGCRYNECLHPDRKKALLLIKNLMAFYKEKAKPYLLYGKMEKALPVECECLSYDSWTKKIISLPKVYSTAWSFEGKRVQILVNSSEEAQTVKLGENTVTIDGLSGLLVEL